MKTQLMNLDPLEEMSAVSTRHAQDPQQQHSQKEVPFNRQLERKVSEREVSEFPSFREEKVIFVKQCITQNDENVRQLEM